MRKKECEIRNHHHYATKGAWQTACRPLALSFWQTACRPLVLSFIIFHLSFSPAGAQSPREWRDSLAVLNKMIAAQPQSTDLRLKKAAVNIELQQWEYAVEEYGRVLELDSKNPAALYFRAYCYNHLRRYDMARADYERFLQIVPRHFDAQLGLAMTKRYLGKTLETQDELNRLVALYPDSALAYAARADFEQEQKQYDLALYDWDEALRLRPGQQDFLLSKYNVLWSMKRYDEARHLQDELLKAGMPRTLFNNRKNVK